jgi:hypothetical protein
MTKHEWKVGEVTIVVETPEGVPVKGVIVSVEPASREEFLGAVEAVGGLRNVIVPSQEESWTQSAHAYSADEDGKLNYAAAIDIKEPPREREPQEPKAHPFFGPLAERKVREDRERAEDERVAALPRARDDAS